MLERYFSFAYLILISLIIWHQFRQPSRIGRLLAEIVLFAGTALVVGFSVFIAVQTKSLPNLDLALLAFSPILFGLWVLARRMSNVEMTTLVSVRLMMFLFKPVRQHLDPPPEPPPPIPLEAFNEGERRRLQRIARRKKWIVRTLLAIPILLIASAIINSLVQRHVFGRVSYEAYVEKLSCRNSAWSLAADTGRVCDIVYKRQAELATALALNEFTDPQAYWVEQGYAALLSAYPICARIDRLKYVLDSTDLRWRERDTSIFREWLAVYELMRSHDPCPQLPDHGQPH